MSSAASANDVNEARCNPLICEPTVFKFKILPPDYALVLMTDKLYQMYLKAGGDALARASFLLHFSLSVGTEEDIPKDLLELIRESINLPTDCAEHILSMIERRFSAQNPSTQDDLDMQQMGLLIHFFHQPKSSTQAAASLPTKINHSRRAIVGEVTVEEVRNFIKEHNEMRQRREQSLHSASNFAHKRETQSHNNSIEPFVRFDVYEKLLREKPELREANDLITELLYTQSTTMIEQSLNDFLNAHPSLKCD